LERAADGGRRLRLEDARIPRQPRRNREADQAGQDQNKAVTRHVHFILLLSPDLLLSPRARIWTILLTWLTFRSLEPMINVTKGSISRAKNRRKTTPGPGPRLGFAVDA
jgi:hypothetical protein